MVNIAILDIGNVQAGDLAVITENPEIRVSRNDSRLENLLANHGRERMGSSIGVGFDEPRVIRTGLEDELSSTRSASFQVDKGPGLEGPGVLCDESMTSGEHVLLGTVEQKHQALFHWLI